MLSVYGGHGKDPHFVPVAYSLLLYTPDFYTRYGGAANTLCLPSDPELSNRTAPGGSYIYGTEYEQNFFTSGASNEDVPCAVCRASNTFTSIMIPGRKSCYNGWQMEYNGILASDSYADKASSFICVINLLVINYKKKFFSSIVIYNFKIAQ
jgi:hypothetical protein